MICLRSHRAEAVAQFHETLSYKLEGSGSIPSRFLWIFHLVNTTALELFLSLTEKSTRNLFCGVKAAGG
jgi:hypothetical protein